MTLMEQGHTENYLKGRGIPYRIQVHHASETALEEAKELHWGAEDVLKAVLLKVGDRFAVAVTPASRRVDLRPIRHAVDDEPVRLATEAEITLEFPDLELGAIPPLPGQLGIRGFVDPAIFDHSLVAFADGKKTESVIANPRRIFWGENIIVTPISKEDRKEAWRFEGDAASYF